MRTVFISKTGQGLWRTIGDNITDFNASSVTVEDQGWTVSGADIISNPNPSKGPWVVSGADIISN